MRPKFCHSSCNCFTIVATYLDRAIKVYLRAVQKNRAIKYISNHILQKWDPNRLTAHASKGKIKHGFVIIWIIFSTYLSYRVHIPPIPRGVFINAESGPWFTFAVYEIVCFTGACYNGTRSWSFGSFMPGLHIKAESCHLDMISASWTDKRISILHVYFQVTIAILGISTPLHHRQKYSLISI